jgi:sporadic carbohydrate cluster 2OG-Fe(II) oxygenase
LKETQLASALIKDGYVRLNLSERSSREIINLNKRMILRLKDKWKISLSSLETYHEFVIEDDRNTDIQEDLTEIVHTSGAIRRIVVNELHLLRQLIGNDLHIQKYPYLRIARPGKLQDNIGYHRDTNYGSSPYEISLHIPFTNVGVTGSLAFLSGSQYTPDRDLVVRKVKSVDVERGSRKHKLGFLYEPKILPEKVTNLLKPRHTKVGQAMLFCLSTLHGQIENRSQRTRISVDVRLVNSLAPIDWSRSVHGDYYEQLESCAVTRIASIFTANNEP